MELPSATIGISMELSSTEDTKEQRRKKKEQLIRRRSREVVGYPQIKYISIEVVILVLLRIRS